MAQSDLGLSCPRGGDWYICQNTKIEFVGCCTIDPCADGTGLCPLSRLRTATFSSSKYEDIPPLECFDSEPQTNLPEPSFYTCTGNNPPFMGCCYNNPCGTRCSDGNLTTVRLPGDETNRQKFLRNAGVLNNPSGSNSKLSTGAIVGIAVGAVVALVAVLAALWFLRRRKQQKKAAAAATAAAVPNTPPQMAQGGFPTDPKSSPSPGYSPHASQLSPHSAYGYPGTPPTPYGFQNGYQNGYQHQNGYQQVPTELETQRQSYAELSGNQATEVSMLDGTPIQHPQAHSPVLPPPSAATTLAPQSGWPADNK